MSASSLTPPARRHQAPAPCGPPSRSRATSVLVGSALVLLLSGCAGEATSAPTPSSAGSPSATAAPTPVDETAELLAQYRKFWASLTPVSRLPAAERRSVMAELAVDPALKSILFGMTQADSKGQVFYGADVPRPTVRINPDATTALVDDCQDSSRAGILDKRTGDRVTVGVARNHVSVTMKKQPGGLWKVFFVDYAKSSC
jgi:hypothetical protein